MFKRLPLWLTILTLVPIGPTFAHHPVQAKFDMAQPLELSGRVTAIDWFNPHTHIFINVEDPSGTLVSWAVELQSPIELEWGGWRPDSLSVGDMVTVTGPQARDGSDQIWGNEIVASGKGRVFELPDNILESQLSAPTGRPAPRWPDGHPRLGPEPGQSGYWSVPSLRALTEDGVNIPMDIHGLLANLNDAPRVAPFQDWSRDLYIHRQQDFLSEDPLFLACIPPGGPRMFQVDLRRNL
jgi:hypothetical protein